MLKFLILLCLLHLSSSDANSYGDEPVLPGASPEPAAGCSEGDAGCAPNPPELPPVLQPTGTMGASPEPAAGCSEGDAGCAPNPPELPPVLQPTGTMGTSSDQKTYVDEPLAAAPPMLAKAKADPPSDPPAGADPADPPALAFSLAASPVCPDREHWVQCATCESTCGRPNPPCTRECKPARCMCISGYSRNINGKCVLTSNCVFVNPTTPTPPGQPVCTNNQQRVLCAACDSTCANPYPACPTVCGLPRCICLYGFSRNVNGQCVRTENCPFVNPTTTRAPTTCGPGEYWNSCGNQCDGTCQNYYPPCPGACGPPACACYQGYVRNYLGQCVPSSYCWQWGK